MTSEDKKLEEIRKMVNEVVELQRKGKPEEGLKLLEKASKKAWIAINPRDIIAREGLIYHYKGRILQAMGRYKEADEVLEEAKKFRRGDPIQFGYTVFQIFINRIYGNIPISPEEIKETKAAMWIWADASTNLKEFGDAFQNLAYIEQETGNRYKAISLYLVTTKIREEAEDLRGLALTWARLAECYRKIHNNNLSEKYGTLALDYFKATGDIERIQQIKKNVFGE